MLNISSWSILTELRKKWFLLAVVVVILLAQLYPALGAKYGPIRPEYTVKYLAVSLIFFSSGLSLKTEELRQALSQVKLHIFIQSYTLIFIPIVICLTVRAIGPFNAINPLYLQGLQVVGCMPPPVSSAVILTKAVGGNEAAAIFNSAVGSFLGIIVTPLLLLVFVGTTTAVPFVSIFIQLSATVLVPLGIGQLVRQVIKKWIEEKQPPFGTISSCILLLIIYTTFCDTFKNTNSSISLTSVLSVIIMVILTQLTLIIISGASSGYIKSFTRKDRVSILFCSTHKSLTLGIPILKIVFTDSPDLSSFSLPLLIYHPTQILLGSFLVSYLQTWVQEEPPPPPPSPPSTPTV